MKLVKPVSSFLRNTFSELGGDAAQEMARSFDQQRRVACVKGNSRIRFRERESRTVAKMKHSFCESVIIIY